MDGYVVGYTRLTRKVERPKVLLITAARGDKEWDIRVGRETFERLGCEVDVLELLENPIEINATDAELLAMSDGDRDALVQRANREKILSQDLIYVMGGNTRLLLYALRDHGVDAMLFEAYKSGVVMFGMSAGSLFPTLGGTTDSWHLRALQPIKCLGWLRFTFNPHHDKGIRRQLYLDRVADGTLEPGCAGDDGVILLYENGKLIEVVADRENAHAYIITREGGVVSEQKLDCRLLV
jgi:peptidase E